MKSKEQSPEEQSSIEKKDRASELTTKLQEIESILAEPSNMPYQRTLDGIVLAAIKLINSPSPEIGEEKCREQLEFLLVSFPPGRRPD
jgi:hypothetical protein